MELQTELRRIRPGITVILSTLVTVALVAVCIVGYYFYFNLRINQPMPVGIIMLLCAGCFYAGILGARLRHRFEIGRLMRRIDQ